MGFEEPPHPATISAMTDAVTAARESLRARLDSGSGVPARRGSEADDESMSMLAGPLSVVVYGMTGQSSERAFPAATPSLQRGKACNLCHLLGAAARAD